MNKRKLRKNKIELIIMGIITLTVAVWSYFGNNRADIRIYAGGAKSDIIQTAFIDVGQGDSALIRTSSGEKILIDGGDKGSGDILRRYFAANAISKLDAAIVSHYHADHAEGIYEILDEFPIDVLYMPDVQNRPQMHDDLVRIADKYGVAVDYIDAGDIIEFDDGTTFNVLFPSESLYINDEENINNDSLVIKVSFGESDFLFTGDLESDAEQTLIKRAELDSEVLKVSHHASKTSSSRAFLKAVAPDIAIINAGEDNRYKHPHKQAVDRLEKCGAEIYRTDLNGNIIVRADKDGNVEVETEKRVSEVK